MTELSNEKKKHLLKKVIWDYNVEPNILLEILTGKQKNYGHIDRKYLINRCFNYLNWYQFISLFDKYDLLEVLQEVDVSFTAYYRRRKQSYPGLEFAKRFLHKETLSTSG